MRRDVLLSGIGALATWGMASAAPNPVPLAEAPVDPDVSRFMGVSRCLTDRPELDPRVGAALYAGIIHSSAERKAQISTLHDIMTKHRLSTAAELAKTAEKADRALKDTIHDIMVGWYRGVADGKVVVYRSALMFDITKDAIYPKTYAEGGPFYWTTQPPEVVRPSGRPALSPSPFVVEPT